MNCPVCNISLMMAEKNGVEIDYCPKCRGIWLDRGELEKIIERSDKFEKTYDSHSHEREGNHYNDHSYQSNHHRYHRKKGFLGDLFDF